jgi:hypothetical protein
VKQVITDTHIGKVTAALEHWSKMGVKRNEISLLRLLDQSQAVN